MKFRQVASGILLLACLAAVRALPAATPPEWTHPFPALQIDGNLYYVGSEDLASYLIATSDGLILINSSLEASVPLIQKSVESLGFHFRDIKILLISHAHYDHCAGSAKILKLTGAKYYVMDADVPVVESGGKADFQFGDDLSMRFPPAHVDRVLRDGDTVRLGNTVLTAHLTAGHTKGTTTWTFDEPDLTGLRSGGGSGRPLHVVIAGGAGLNTGYRLVNNNLYPRIASDYEHTFEVLNSLPCDVFLGAHGSYFDMRDKFARLKSGDRTAFVDPAGYKAQIARWKDAFEAELARQSSAKQ